MDQETMLNGILDALKLHANDTDKKLELMGKNFDRKFELMEKKFDALEEKMDLGFARVNQRLDRLDKKGDGMRVELTETQEPTDFILTKIAQHEQKLRLLTTQ